MVSYREGWVQSILRKYFMNILFMHITLIESKASRGNIQFSMHYTLVVQKS